MTLPFIEFETQGSNKNIQEKTMRTSITLSTALMLSIAFYGAPILADWGSLLDDVTKEVGGDAFSKQVPGTSSLDSSTIISGLKEALDIGTRKAVEGVSKKDGYLSNELIRIAMPPELQQASDLMRQFGLSSEADAFEASMNDAASNAAPAATNIIIDAINNMNIQDAKKLLNGPDDAATQYFKEKTTPQLTALFHPTISKSLDSVGTTKYYNDLTGQIADIPFVGEEINMDLPDYVTQQALTGIFTMIALEEKNIRENPTARTTDLLKSVFGE